MTPPLSALIAAAREVLEPDPWSKGGWEPSPESLKALNKALSALPTNAVLVPRELVEEAAKALHHGLKAFEDGWCIDWNELERAQSKLRACIGDDKEGAK